MRFHCGAVGKVPSTGVRVIVSDAAWNCEDAGMCCSLPRFASKRAHLFAAMKSAMSVVATRPVRFKLKTCYLSLAESSAVLCIRKYLGMVS